MEDLRHLDGKLDLYTLVNGDIRPLVILDFFTFTKLYLASVMAADIIVRLSSSRGAQMPDKQADIGIPYGVAVQDIHIK